MCLRVFACVCVCFRVLVSQQANQEESQFASSTVSHEAIQPGRQFASKLVSQQASHPANQCTSNPVCQ